MLAVTFPGQGSQRPGMGAAWRDHPAWRLVDEASEHAGRDVARLLLEADADELRDTRNAQLTTFVTSLVVNEAARELGIDPAFAAGHSLGEYTALTAAGALPYADGVRLVVARADAMHAAGTTNPGTMAAVLGLDDELVDAACAAVDGDVWVANYNAPGQVVIAGSADGVAAGGEAAKQRGAKKVMPLQVSGAFHTAYMAAAGEQLATALAAAAFADSTVPVVSNVDAAAHSAAADFPTLLAAQLSSPVRWRHSLATLAAAGVTDFVELGPGGVLAGMAKRSVDGARTLSVANPDDLQKLAEFLAG